MEELKLSKRDREDIKNRALSQELFRKKVMEMGIPPQYFAPRFNEPT